MTQFYSNQYVSSIYWLNSKYINYKANTKQLHNESKEKKQLKGMMMMMMMMMILIKVRYRSMAFTARTRGQY